MTSFKMVKSGVKARPTWLYPQVVGCNPSERWGHSACFADGILYVFGGCCGGLHFSDVLTLDLNRMTWSSLVTTGQQPGTRDSHSAVLVGHKMVVFGGTNGSKKINDLHILDLKTRDWTQPAVEGRPPAPRESHSATLMGDNKLVVFGGSGEGEGNYLNDVHILDLDSMKWTSPDVIGDLPACRDSHTAVAVGNRLVVYGGDCGDHYLGEVDILDLDNLSWSKIEPVGSSFPGVRAGHASVAINKKVYIIGGVGDRAYYNDVWILDINTRTWALLDVCGSQPQGRFSHSAVLADSNIAIYGGCGEDEHPLDEIIILHLGSDCNNGAALSISKIFANPCSLEHRRLSGFRRISVDVTSDNGPTNATETSNKDQTATMPVERAAGTVGEPWKEDFKQNMRRFSEVGESNPSSTRPDECDVAKKRKILLGRIDIDPEQEEHSHSLSQQSSPSQSDQEQTVQKRSKIANSRPTQPLGMFLQHQPQNSDNQQKPRTYPFLHQFPLQSQHANVGNSQTRIDFQQPPQQHQKVDNVLCSIPGVQLKARVPHQPNTIPLHGNIQTCQGHQIQFASRDPVPSVPDTASRIGHHRRLESPAGGDKQQRVAVAGIVAVPNLVGAEVRGTVDAVFDSGYLMTAQVNGQVFRGLLFNPGPAVSIRDANMVQSCSALANCHGNPGIVFAPPPNHVQSVQRTPSCMNGAILGSPVLPGVHMGSVTQPANWSRSASAGYAPENQTETSAGPPGPHLGLMLKTPGSGAPEMPRQVLVRNNPAGPVRLLGAARATIDEAQSATPHLRTAVVEGENCGLPPAGSGGQWLWHPFPPAAPVATVAPLDQHSSAPRRDNVHFVAVPPFPAFSFTSPFNHHEMQPSMVGGGLLQVGSAPAVTDPQAGVILSLGQTSAEHTSNNVSTHKS